MASHVLPVPLPDAPHILSEKICLRGSITCVFATRIEVPLSSPASQCMRTRQNRCSTFPTLVLLVPSLRRREHIWPSFSSLRSEDEVTNVVDYGLACFDSCLVRIVQDGLERVVTRTPFACVSSGREAASIVQLGLL